MPIPHLLSRATLAALAAALTACGGHSSTSPTPAPATTPTGPTTAPFYDVAKLGVPKFVNVVYVDLTQVDGTGAPLVNAVSLFRSSVGHDYSDSFETCRSMKHYFAGLNNATRLYAPVSGTIEQVNPSGSEAAITIQSDTQPAFWFTIFHPVLTGSFAAGQHVVEGQFLGTHVSSSENSDIAVLVNPGETGPVSTPMGINGQLVSYFDTLTDAAFAPFRTRGIGSASSVIITQAERSAAPLSCTTGGLFTMPNDPLPQYVHF